LENPPKSDDDVVQLAMEAATDAACAVIQKHLGANEGGYAAAWWSGAEDRYPGIKGRHGFEGALSDYLRDQRQAEMNDDSLEAALTHTLEILKAWRGPEPGRAAQAMVWIEDILAQLDCANWTYLDLTPDESGVVRIPTRGEGCDRLTSLIATIIRG
jgi:hypothetical protein